LTRKEEFDVNQMGYGSEFFMSLKATVFDCLFDLGQMIMRLTLMSNRAPELPPL
jgi:hypothetical protein